MKKQMAKAEQKRAAKQRRAINIVAGVLSSGGLYGTVAHRPEAQTIIEALQRVFELRKRVVRT